METWQSLHWEAERHILAPSVTAGPLCGAAHCSARGTETVADPFKANPNPPLKTEHKHHAAKRANWRLGILRKKKRFIVMLLLFISIFSY